MSNPDQAALAESRAHQQAFEQMLTRFYPDSACPQCAAEYWLLGADGATRSITRTCGRCGLRHFFDPAPYNFTVVWYTPLFGGGDQAIVLPSGDPRIDAPDPTDD